MMTTFPIIHFLGNRSCGNEATGFINPDDIMTLAYSPLSGSLCSSIRFLMEIIALFSLLADLLRRFADMIDSVSSADEVSANTVLPRSRIVDIHFCAEIPEDATRQQIEEWVCSSLGGNSISGENPLSDHEMDVFGLVHLHDTGTHAHIAAYRHQGHLHISRTISTERYSGASIQEIITHADHPAIIDATPPWLRR